MSKTGFAAFLLLILCKGYSQQNFYFVLIQADNNQPFYARIDDRILNSSSAGWLAIPQLKDSDYDLSIGFPENVFPELRFSIQINKKDQDFQLRNLGEKGWALYNQQAEGMSLPAKADTSNNLSASRGIKEDNAFSRLMAGVVNDSSILYNTFDSLHLDTVRNSTIRPDSVLAEKEKKPDTVARNGLVKTSSTIKKKPVRTTRPAHRAIEKLKTDSSAIAHQPVDQDKPKQGPADTVKISPVKDSVKLDIVSIRKPPGTIVLVNSDCRNFATETDAEKFRSKIAGENNEDQKIVLAKKYFKTKCFSVEQIKALSDLFPGDERRFNFFEAAYPFVSDPGNFLQLAGLLSNDLYVTRLKALISKT
jgi:hypothetical protein